MTEPKKVYILAALILLILALALAGCVQYAKPLNPEDRQPPAWLGPLA